MAPCGVLSSPSPRSGFVAGEGWSCCVGRGRLSVLLWPAVEARRGAGGGRRSVFVAGDGVRLLRLLLCWLVVVAWGAEAGVAAVRAVVVLGDAEPAGSLVEAGRWCRGRFRSSILGSVAVRRTADATVYKLERRLLPGGGRYGGAVFV